jgi:selenocysteine lyase/cysteine desulfurase
MLNRKSFLQNTLLSGAGLAFFNKTHGFITEPILPEPPPLPGSDRVHDEKYWKHIRSLFYVPKDFINLENGYFSPQPKTTLAFHQKREADINKRTSWFMRREQNDAIENARKALAVFLGCPVEELALTRNTTESMNIIISGYPWQRGDEVVIGDQDYGSMVAAYRQAEKRHGIVVNVAKIPLQPKSDEEVIDAYRSLFNPNTRLVHITHLINLTGQVVPVASIARAAREVGAEVSVDSAHSVAQLKFMIPDLQADYVSASLHKWLCNPLGAGFLWMKKVHVSKIYPLMGDDVYPSDNIRQFEHQGTRPIQTLETIAEAIAFHNKIGTDIKEQRLRYLMRTWVKEVAGIPGITINTPFADDARCGAIANVAVKGYTPASLAETLLKDHKIFTVAIDHPVVKGVRVTPHIYNTLDEVKALVVALKKIAKG